LQRQASDCFVRQAQKEGYRCRAAYKLLELAQNCGFLREAHVVVDLGAAPGGWSQVLAQQCPRVPAPLLIAVDPLPFPPIAGVVSLCGKIEEESTALAIDAVLQGRKVDVVLSDMAPNTMGRASVDHLRSVSLVEAAYDFACQHLASGGHFVAKLFLGGTESSLVTSMKQHFRTVRYVKPQASRSESREIYLVSQGFRG
jgi:23S rRNA (uridine2552-2'-O)-methyltransferase